MSPVRHDRTTRMKLPAVQWRYAIASPVALSPRHANTVARGNAARRRRSVRLLNAALDGERSRTGRSNRRPGGNPWSRRKARFSARMLAEPAVRYTTGTPRAATVHSRSTAPAIGPPTRLSRKVSSMSDTRTATTGDMARLFFSPQKRRATMVTAARKATTAAKRAHGGTPLMRKVRVLVAMMEWVCHEPLRTGGTHTLGGVWVCPVAIDVVEALGRNGAG